jgi:large repetitive protein
MKKLFLTLLLVLGITGAAHALEIMPVNYSFDQATDSGSYKYSDRGGVQLTDGQYGTAPWYADLGNGNAYEWVGWYNDHSVSIDFNFGEMVSIEHINIGTVQDHPNDVVVPSIAIFSSEDDIVWSLVTALANPESSLNNNQYFTFGFSDLGISAQYISIVLTHTLDGPWTFVDEIDFYDANPVPEPATIMLFGLGLLGLAGVSRKRK